MAVSLELDADTAMNAPLRSRLPSGLEKCVACGDDMGQDLEQSYRFCLLVEDKDGSQIVITASGAEAVR